LLSEYNSRRLQGRHPAVSGKEEMTKLLAIDSSASSADSISRILVDEAVARFKEANPSADVVRRDLGATPVPHLTTANLAGVRGVPSSDEELRARELSDELISELRASDIIVIGAPMYNFSVTTVLRAWFDHVLRAGETFSYSEAGPKGLLEGKRVIVIASRGGLYSDGPAKAYDFQEPYIRHLLGFMGITDVTFVYAEKTGFGPEAREAALKDAKAEIAVLVETALGKAA
jgi:FMN-dependent NADH-azoreductase